MSAAIYCRRAGLDISVVERYAPGGQVMNTYEVENYPGFAEPVSGFELVDAMTKQAERFGTETVSADVVSYEKRSDGNFVVRGSGGEEFEARSLILAMGSSYKHLGIPGETEFIGRGVSYCATCDGAFYKGKVTALVGGGNTALEEAVFLTRFASKVYLIHRRSEFRADKIIIDRVLQNDKIEILYDTVAEAVTGEQKVSAVSLKNKVSGESKSLPVDGFFVFVGYDANNAIVQKDILDEWGQIRVDLSMSTPVPGLFAAGDIRSASKRQIVMACADGATAAMSAYEYLNR
jgi:thioredoxin reductase (NADPH)